MISLLTVLITVYFIDIHVTSQAATISSVHKNIIQLILSRRSFIFSELMIAWVNVGLYNSVEVQADINKHFIFIEQLNINEHLNGYM